MKAEFPGAVPEIPVSNVDRAADYYRNNLGFNLDWGDEAGGGIAGISKGQCRMFLTNPAFREMYGNSGPVVVWLIQATSGPPRYTVLICSGICRLQRAAFSRREVPAMLDA